MKYDYSKLTGKIIEVYGSRRKFAQHIGWPEATVCYKLRSSSMFTQDQIMKMILALGLKVADIPDYFFVVKAQRN